MKSKKEAGKAGLPGLEGGELKMGPAQKKASSMIAIDRVEPTDSSGTGKRLKGDEDGKVVVLVLKEPTKVEAVDVLEHHRPKK